MIRRIPVLALIVLAAVALFGAACGSGSSSSDTPSASSSNSAQTPAPNETPANPGAGITASGAIRSMDIEHAAAVQQLIKATGGVFVANQVIYGDLTGDGIDEAVVPISSGGTMGDIAYTVLTPTANGIATLPVEKGDTAAGGVAVDIVNGKLVDTRPEYGPTDPECCPSMLRKTTYAWSGTKFTIESSETIPNPNGGAKGTPSSVTPPPANPAPASP